jgi:hypothetical protein
MVMVRGEAREWEENIGQVIVGRGVEVLREKVGGKDRVMLDSEGRRVGVVKVNEKVVPGEPLDESETLRLPADNRVVLGRGKVVFPSKFPNVFLSVS